jgi:hypothetical protein
MDKKMLREIQAADADQLVKGKATGKDYLELLPEQDQELAPLLDVAERVQSTLKPITPANKFERDLKQELLTTAQQRQAEGYSPAHPFRGLFVLIATVSFILSLTGVLIALRRRSQPI